MINSDLNKFIHDISTPLTMVKVNLEQYKSDPVQNKIIMQRIEAGIDELSYLVSTNSNQRLNNKSYQPERSTVIKEIAKVLRLYTITFSKYKIDVSQDYQEDYFLIGNIDKFHRIMINLINNSVDALSNVKRRRCITIKTFRDDLGFNLIFSDNGSGINDENITKLFYKQFTTKENGNGLGLLNIRKILFENFNGLISCESSFGKGASFFVIMPDPT